MESVLESGEHLERELTREPFAGPAAGSVGLHLAIVGTACFLRLGDGSVSSQLLGHAGRGRSDAGDPDEQRFRCPPTR